MASTGSHNSSESSGTKPVRLSTEFKDKIWGRHDLSPLFPDSESKVGEVWFQADLPLLVKFVFTSEKLSVQVHPNDEFAGEHENSLGKTEMWHVVKADAGAQVALGFREPITPERMREAALSGEIEKLLKWVDVKAGDTFFVPPGTVHALGAGLMVCEIQQYSDITYRLYDYGRPRELHLEKSMAVASTAPAEAGSQTFPVECKYFHTEPLEFSGEQTYGATDRFHIAIVLSGKGTIAGMPFHAGEAWLIPQGCAAFALRSDDGARLLRTWVP